MKEPVELELERLAEADREAALKRCPKGFVPRVGFGNARTCQRCGELLESHAVVAQ